MKDQYHHYSTSPLAVETGSEGSDATMSLLGKNENIKPRNFCYGSAGTMSTWIQSSSSSSSHSSSTEGSSSSENKNTNGNDVHHVGIDLTVIDGSEEDKINCDDECGIISTNSSYSDISSNGGGYYDRYARFQWTQYNKRYTIFTTNNFKVVLSFCMWFATYMFMGIFGGSVAYMHFPRTDAEIPKTLPDFGYDVIPVSYSYNCFSVLFHFCIDNFLKKIFNFKPRVFFANFLVFMPAHTSCSSRQCSKLCAIHTVLYRHRRCGCTLETSDSSYHKSDHLGW